MKLKIKYSSTQKFIVTLDDPSLGVLKHEIRKFVDNTYKQTVGEPLLVSLNGSDPLLGDDSTTLNALGIVPGDILTILPTSSSSDMDIPSSVPSPQPDSFLSKQEPTSSSSRMQNSGSNETANTSSTPEGDGDVKRVNLLDVKDGYPSASLETLFSECLPTSASQAVNLIVHLTMTECGFHTESNVDVPPGWKEMVASFQYFHNSFPEFQCTLVLVTMGEVKQILASFPQQENEISVKVKVSDYVNGSSASPIPPRKLIRVAQLARTLRDRLLHPLQVAAHQALGVPAPWHLSGLPQEILLKIASLLEARDVLNLAETCRRLNSALDDNKLWQTLFKRDFESLYFDVKNLNLVDWKAKYKEAVARRKEWKRLYDEGLEFVTPEGIPRMPNRPTHPFGPYHDFPRPRGDDPYPPQPHPRPNPYFDPDSPYFGGEIPPMPNPYPNLSDPFDPFGMRPLRPRPQNPFNPPFMPPRPRNPRGPRFDFF